MIKERELAMQGSDTECMLNVDGKRFGSISVAISIFFIAIIAVYTFMQDNRQPSLPKRQSAPPVLHRFPLSARREDASDRPPACHRVAPEAAATSREGLTLGQELARLWIELRRSAGQIDEKGGRMFLRASSGARNIAHDH